MPDPSVGGGQDTTAVDSAPPPPTLPDLPGVGPDGWGRGVWVFDRDALLRMPNLSLLQLLERIPGLTTVRIGIVNQAESASVFGATTGAIRYEVDGFELDPLASPTFDASRVSLLALERVRVERRVTGATVRLTTLSPTDPRTETIIEAATGDIGINMFRGTFLAPSVLGGPLALGFERLGATAVGESGHTTTWLKWTWARDSVGIQLAYRSGEMDRDDLGAGLVGRRTDWAVRARGTLGPVRAEAYGGAATVEDEVGALVVHEGTPQGGIRLRSNFPSAPVELGAAVRLRSHPRRPRQEVELSGRVAPTPWLAASAEAVQGWWDRGSATGRWSARGEIGPVVGLSAFGEVFGGAPPLDPDGHELRFPATADSLSVAVARDGFRAGGELRWGRLHLGAAALRAEADVVPGFGLAFDSTAPSFGGGTATGLEAVARLPFPWEPLRLEGWYVQMDRPFTWLYLPHRQWQAALVYHHLPLPSGNLELYSRLEHVYRGRMVVPDGTGRVTVPDIRATNFELVIRVLSVRAFIRWDNVLHRLDQRDLAVPPVFPGQRVLYGVKWTFWN
jgi:hypothetical protein